ncbi:hypothetical protein EM932_06285 [Flavivirga rizhaonensis]|uniref:Uncharacterized protein n=1 Tax=Flavivirga rizhaonensis TaxID=2559571 RepID=A0A4S1DZH5_9FLAO|nr:hypothetical protein EM932_06285 [Flavivirga rizhaonensis]
MDILAQIQEQDFNQIGQLEAGFLYGSVKNVGAVPAIVNGVTLAPGEAKGYPFVGKGYQAVSFDPNGSTLRVLVII